MSVQSSLCPKAIYPTIVILLIITTPVSGLTTFTPAPPNSTSICFIKGDADVYGPGIRISYYLQWFSVLLATHIAPTQIQYSRYASNIVTISVLASTFFSFRHKSGSGSHEENLIALEYPILYSLVFVLTLGFIPTSERLLRKSRGNIATMGVFWAVIVFIQCWLWFKGVDMGKKEGCILRVYFLFWEVNIYNSKWRTFFQMESVVTTAIGAIFMLLKFLKHCVKFGRIMKAIFRNDQSIPRENSSIVDDKAGEEIARWILTGFLLLLGVIAIMQVERTIKINSIDLKVSLTDSGQFIPLVAGIWTVLATLGSWLMAWMKGRYLEKDQSHDLELHLTV
ncbi:hypothetical protein BGZ60DRAFT_521269 [Tricladium varicosporioides]|nr:hypothetical protein BGZ60DRAFT_521269 [Hymenoscyphus varicosporioides]